MTQGVYLDDYMNDLKQELETLPEVYDCVLFGGQFTKEDLDDLNLQPGYATVLLTGVGGTIAPGHNPNQLAMEAAFGAYIIMDTDSDTMGHSPDGSRLSQKIAGLLQQNNVGKQTPGAVGLPNFKELRQMPSPTRDDSQFATWSIIWIQKIILRTT